MIDPSLPLSSLIQLLADGAPRTPAVMAERLAISTREVNLMLLELEQAGMPLLRADAGTMRVRAAFSPLERATIATHLAELGIGAQVHVGAVIGSTNSELLGAARESRLGAGLVILAAELQSAGRGRQGRAWHSAPGTSLAVSVAVALGRSLAALSGLSLCCGLAVRDALLRHGVEATLKWPNDILFGNRKLAGILVEVHPTSASSTVAVVGVGINTGPDPRRAEQLDLASGALSSIDMVEAGARAPVDRNRLIADLADTLSARLAIFAMAGFGPFVEEWNGVHAHQGRPVVMAEHGEIVMRGVARGVDSWGRLCLDTDQGRREIIVGDVTLRTA